MKKLILILILFLSNLAIAENRQLSLFGITVHGIEGNSAAAKHMRNKITSDGLIASNPQLNLTYFEDDGSFKNITALIDCYASPALFLGTGKQYQVKHDLSLGYVLGLYLRSFPPREEIDLFRIGNYQFIPAPALSLQYTLGNGLYLRVQTNYVINFIDIAWNF